MKLLVDSVLNNYPFRSYDEKTKLATIESTLRFLHKISELNSIDSAEYILQMVNSAQLAITPKGDLSAVKPVLKSGDKLSGLFFKDMTFKPGVTHKVSSSWLTTVLMLELHEVKEMSRTSVLLSEFELTGFQEAPLVIRDIRGHINPDAQMIKIAFKPKDVVVKVYSDNRNHCPKELGKFVFVSQYKVLPWGS